MNTRALHKQGAKEKLGQL